MTQNNFNKENNSNQVNYLSERLIMNYLNGLKNPFVNITVKDVAKDLHIGINQAYELFDHESFPAIKVGKRKMISLPAYLIWKLQFIRKENEYGKK